MKAPKLKLVRDYTALGTFLAEARQAAGFTQREVAAKLQYSSAQFISNFERGISRPPLLKLRFLLNLYGANQALAVQALLKGEETRVLATLNKKGRK